jgi:hypothetical protein
MNKFEESKEYTLAEKFALSRAGMYDKRYIQYLTEFLISKEVVEFWEVKFRNGDTPLKTAEFFLKESPPLTVSELENFNLDDNDIALIRILKNKLVRLQLYDLAAQLRDIEKDIIVKIEYAKIKKSEARTNEYKESLEFGDFLLRNFTACHWYTDPIPEIEQVSSKVFGYTKNDDIESGKTYTTDDVYRRFLVEKIKESLPNVPNKNTPV